MKASITNHIRELGAVSCNSFSFMANAILPVSFSLPCINAWNGWIRLSGLQKYVYIVEYVYIAILTWSDSYQIAWKNRIIYSCTSAHSVIISITIMQRHSIDRTYFWNDSCSKNNMVEIGYHPWLAKQPFTVMQNLFHLVPSLPLHYSLLSTSRCIWCFPKNSQSLTFCPSSLPVIRSNKSLSAIVMVQSAFSKTETQK